MLTIGDISFEDRSEMQIRSMSYDPIKNAERRHEQRLKKKLRRLDAGKSDKPAKQKGCTKYC